MAPAGKVLPLDRLVERLVGERHRGRTVALANGLFDLLHVGHLRYLEAAAREAHILVVAVNSDRSARQLRGPSRPIVPDHERAELVAGFACVDFVTIFEAMTVEPLLRTLRPDVHCKGTDYTPGDLPETGVAQELGIRIAIVGDPKHHHTTELMLRVHRSCQNNSTVDR
jgi:rfaE bifunctional protein nucleotidyltransferase chain/domain